MRGRLRIVAIVFIIVGIIMLMVGATHYGENADRQVVHSWWTWGLLIGGIIILIKGIMILGLHVRNHYTRMHSHHNLHNEFHGDMFDGEYDYRYHPQHEYIHSKITSLPEDEQISISIYNPDAEMLPGSGW